MSSANKHNEASVYQNALALILHEKKFHDHDDTEKRKLAFQEPKIIPHEEEAACLAAMGTNITVEHECEKYVKEIPPGFEPTGNGVALVMAFGGESEKSC